MTNTGQMNACDGILEGGCPSEIRTTPPMHVALLESGRDARTGESAQGPGRFSEAVYKMVPSFETATHTRLDSEEGESPDVAMLEWWNDKFGESCRKELLEFQGQKWQSTLTLSSLLTTHYWGGFQIRNEYINN